jgi:hypothetical protein
MIALALTNYAFSFKILQTSCVIELKSSSIEASRNSIGHECEAYPSYSERVRLLPCIIPLTLENNVLLFLPKRAS